MTASNHRPIRAALALFLLCLLAACQLQTIPPKAFPQGSGGVNAGQWEINGQVIEVDSGTPL